MDHISRKMIARRAFPHDGQDVEKGDTFWATNVDAGYLYKHGKAEFAQDEEAPAAPVAVPPAPAPPPAEALVEPSAAVVQPEAPVSEAQALASPEEAKSEEPTTTAPTVPDEEAPAGTRRRGNARAASKTN